MVAMLNANQLCDNLGFVDFNDDVQIPSSFDHERSDVPGHQHDFRHQKSQLEAWGCEKRRTYASHATANLRFLWSADATNVPYDWWSPERSSFATASALPCAPYRNAWCPMRPPPPSNGRFRGPPMGPIPHM
ncbi:hypothetical protein RP20_CCG018826 [Aedes albopictus]|nr:hypothetical protein RP20_CCG018826 [Aedes albopictus]